MSKDSVPAPHNPAREQVIVQASAPGDTSVSPDRLPEGAAPGDRAFRFKSGSVIRAGWLAEDLPFLNRSLRYLLRGQGGELRREFALESGDIGVLGVLQSNPGVTQNDLAASLVLKKSAVTRVVQRLEARGLLTRARSSVDRRANVLNLTEAGMDLSIRVREAAAARHAEWFTGISPDERAVFFDVLFRLVDRLAETHSGDATDEDDD
ncbi:winged helix-turn-helix transcriptional regulator [Rhodobacter sp. NTK016B]|uniref:MarR family winged helix-turn-helix transcriptional regulator n=1 Tax=Rhodobacter sp. NTK016B TaxID=2759676 RepID=UPI001A8F3A7E|nr:MarR family winged helix-turn-helix transcriptional regulator [Rhodobacter sp. NTK016B]MBN8294007.1 winged helix-turn-helix transcriptional regulator [Rhodobacter sp. NTK016B]